MQDLITGFVAAVPRLVGALVLLVVGLIVAAVVAGVVRAALRRTGLDRRLAGALGGGQVDAAAVVGRAIYYLIVLFVLIAVLNALGLTAASVPLALLVGGILGFVPKLLGAAILFVLALVLATILRTIVVQALRALRVDERVGQPEGGASLARTLGEVVYYLVFLFFLPAILGALGLNGLLDPVQNLLNVILGFLPHLVSAALILVVGVFVARLVRTIVANLLAAAGADRLGERLGLAGVLGGLRLSGTVGLLVYLLILLPVITAALDALQLAALTAPVSGMLNTILAAIPNIVAAALTVLIAYVVGRVLAGIVAGLLAGVGFNQLPARLGLGGAPRAGARTPAELAGTLVQAALVYVALVAALNLLGFGAVAAILVGLLALLGHLLLGLIVFAVALWLARLAAGAVRGSGVPNAGALAWLAQGAVLILGGAIALRQMGVADSIINLAFGLLLGALAVAAALAFGLGGREVAGRELERLARAAHAGTLPEPPVAAPPPVPPVLPVRGGDLLGQPPRGDQ
jgi:hypothetical protein